MGAICRQAGHRFGDHVEKVVPLVLQYAKMEDEELREQCLQVNKSLGSFLFVVFLIRLHPCTEPIIIVILNFRRVKT